MASDVDYLSVLQGAPPERELAASQKQARRLGKMTNVARAERAAHAASKARRRRAALENLKKAQAALAAKRALASEPRGASKPARTKKKTASKRPKKAVLTPRATARSTSKSKGSTMAKKGHKQTAKQKAASLRNLEKARRAKKRKAKGTLTTRTASRATAPARPKRAKAAAAKRPFTAKQRAAALRNLGKARSARRAAKAAGRKHDVGPYSYHSKAKDVHVPAHRSYETGARRSKQTPAQRRASLANLRKARAARKHHGREESPRARKGGASGRRAHKQTPAQRRASLANLKKARAARSHGREGSYEQAMENALGGMEMFFGMIGAVTWFMLIDFLDRLYATHALTDKNTKDAAGHELYADVAPTTGDYANLFNATAICAPMNLTRWLAGLGVGTGVPLLALLVVSDETARAALQGAAFGGTVRIVGKGLIDLVAYITMWNPFGQQLYDGEMRAQVIASSDQTPLASLPSAGLGKADCTCHACSAGVGACTGVGAGWPSEPREVAKPGASAPSPATPGSVAPPPPPAPPPPASLPSASAAPGGTLQGIPEGHPLPVGRNPYKWGSDREAA